MGRKENLKCLFLHLLPLNCQPERVAFRKYTCEGSACLKVDTKQLKSIKKITSADSFKTYMLSTVIHRCFWDTSSIALLFMNGRSLVSHSRGISEEHPSYTCGVRTCLNVHFRLLALLCFLVFEFLVTIGALWIGIRWIYFPLRNSGMVM